MTGNGRVWAWRGVLFAAEAAYMLFELLAVRVMAPSFGTSLDVWTAIIGCVLLAGALGNWIGGKLCAKRWLPAVSLAAAALLCCMVVPLSSSVSAMASALPRPVSALLAAFFLFFLPCIGAGTLPPFAMVEASASSGSVEKAAGGMYAAATLGGLTGTFLGGFVLIPMFGTRVLLLATALLWALLAIVCQALEGRFPLKWADAERPWKIAISFISLAALVSVAGIWMHVTSPASATEEGKVAFRQDTRYGSVVVYDEDGIRHMNVDGGFESAMKLGEGNESEPVFKYAESIEGVVEPKLQGEGKSALCFGGAAYQLPKHFLDCTDADVTVCEIDDGVTELAREWFALDEVEARNPGRLHVEHVDGRVYANEAPAGSFDVVVNDTFAGNTPARVLATREAVSAIEDSLKPGGIYVVNIIGTVDRDDVFMRHELATLASVFDEVMLLNPYGDKAEQVASERCNWTVVCGDDLAGLGVPAGSKVWVVPDLSGVEILTDDWCPVEALTVTELS